MLGVAVMLEIAVLLILVVFFYALYKWETCKTSWSL